MLYFKNINPFYGAYALMLPFLLLALWLGSHPKIIQGFEIFLLAFAINLVLYPMVVVLLHRKLSRYDHLFDAEPDTGAVAAFVHLIISGMAAVAVVRLVYLRWEYLELSLNMLLFIIAYIVISAVVLVRVKQYLRRHFYGYLYQKVKSKMLQTHKNLSQVGCRVMPMLDIKMLEKHGRYRELLNHYQNMHQKACCLKVLPQS